MSPDELDILLEKAAERGADCALKKVGLHDEQAGKDIHEVRSLLESWRETRRTVQQTVAKIITTSILTILAIGSWHYWSQPK